MPVPDLNTAAELSQQQAIFGGLFIFLFFCCIGAVIYLFRTLRTDSLNREKQLKKESKDREDRILKDAKEREDKVMGFIDKNTEKLAEISTSMAVLQNEVNDIKVEISKK